MKSIYIDSDFKCHISNDGTYRQIETIFFDNKCDAFIEGYRYIPFGESWTRYDGVVFRGEMVIPWKPYSELDSAQREYEKQLLQQYKAQSEEYAEALKILEVEI